MYKKRRGEQGDQSGGGLVNLGERNIRRVEGGYACQRRE